MSLSKAMDKLKLDVRMVEINIKNGTLTAEELKEINSKLPDLAANAEPIDLERASQPSQH